MLTIVIGIHDLRQYLKSKKCKLQGLDLECHKQVLELMRFQRLDLTKMTWKMSRMKKGRYVALQILEEKRKWIKSRHISLQKKLEQGSIISRLNEEETSLAIPEYIAGAGDALSWHLLAAAITSIWTTGILPHYANQIDELGNLISPLVAINSSADELGTRVHSELKSRTAATWLYKLGYKYK